MTNEQRAHDIAMLQLKLSMPTIQKKFNNETLKEANFNMTEWYLDGYNLALSTLNERLNPEKK